MNAYIEEIWEQEITEDGIFIERLVPMNQCLSYTGIEIWHYDIFETFAQEMILNIKYQLNNVNVATGEGDDNA